MALVVEGAETGQGQGTSEGAGLSPEQAQQVCRRLKEQGIRQAKVGGFDLDGVLRGKYISLDKLESALAKGFGFCDVLFGWDIGDQLYDRGRVTGWHTGYPDAHAVIDVRSERLIPWEPGVVAYLCSFRRQGGEPHPACPRSLLARVRERAAGLGYTAYFGAEFEFFLFQETRDSLAQKRYLNLTPLDPGMMGYSWLRSGQDGALMRELLDGLEGSGISIEGLHPETGPGVYEAALTYDEVQRAADGAALFKTCVKQIVSRRGLSATFMAKVSEQLPGSSGHLHQSLWRDGRNVFHSAAPGVLSRELSAYLGGVLTLLPSITALLSPTVNSYKRFVPGLWAPLTASWGIDNRTTALRVLETDSPKAARIECRQTAADINPFVAMAACLAAGLWGIEQGLQAPPATTGDAGGSGASLPATLGDATDRLLASEVVSDLLGRQFVEHYAMTRRWEESQYRRAVTDWERQRYFELI